ncbi:aldose epimerase family protein [Paraburkholderia xenovorans]|jgi:aldose 1-epimerase
MIERSTFGVLPDGERIERITLSLESGFSIDVISLGAALQALWAPDIEGQFASVVLGYPTLEDYVSAPGRMGTTMGRYANRIARGYFDLDGVEYRIERNEGQHSIHGGPRGFDRRPWRVANVVDQAGSPKVRLELDSPCGDQGFPGALAIAVTYTLAAPGDVIIDFEAQTDAPTVFNTTNHAYFNLAGEGSGSALHHEVAIFADHYLPVDEELIPIGQLHGVAGTVFDFRKAKPLGRDIRSDDPQIRLGRGYDHCFVLSGAEHSLQPQLAAWVSEGSRGRTLEVLTTEPGLQLHSGNVLNGRYSGLSGRAYRQSDGFCLEAQHFPNSPNVPAFPSTVLRPGDIFRSTTIYRVGLLGGYGKNDGLWDPAKGGQI